MVHPGANQAAPFEILDVLAASGADVSRVVMAHLDRTIQERGKLVELARRGCVLEFDLFGTEASHYQVQMHECIISYFIQLYMKLCLSTGALTMLS